MEFELSFLNEARTWSTAEDVKHAVDELWKVEDKVTTLRLTGNTLGVEAAEAIKLPLEKQSKITRAIFSDLFTNRGKEVIGRALKALSLGLMSAKVSLVELDLSDNAFGPNGVVGVTELIASECCYTLKVLNMNNQGLGHQGCKALVEAMKIARVNSNKKGLNLEVFIAGRNRLENVGMEMLSKVFGDGMTSLKKLVLLQNGIGIHGIKGVESLVIAIRNHRDLEILNISDNTIKSNGMDLLSHVISDLTKLKELYMGDCLLKSEGAKIFSFIAEDSAICPDLKIISLSGNEIKGSEALLIVNAILDGKPAIEKIDLRENEIRKSKFIEIQSLLAENNKEDILEKDDENSEEDVEDESSNESFSCSDGAGDYSEEECNEEEKECSEDEEVKDSTYDSIQDLHGDPNALFSKSSNVVKTAPSRLIVTNSNRINSLFKAETLTQTSTVVETSSINPSSYGGLFPTCSTTSSIFSKPSGLFSANSKASTNNFINTPTLFGNSDKDPNASITTGLFGNSLKDPKASTTTGLFGNSVKDSNASTTSNLFGNSVKDSNASTTSNLFGNSVKDPNASTASGIPNLFGNKFKDTSNCTNLFGAPQTNIFNSKLFSFSEAAKSDIINDGIIPCLRSESLMTITRSALRLTDTSVLNMVLKDDIKTLIEKNPENAVRIAILLCEEEKTFDFGVRIITHLLLSSKWSLATNAILVEMNCIKSEEKRFIPISDVNPILPINVLKKVLDVEELPECVKLNLSTVLKSFCKVSTPETENLLKDLSKSMNKLQI